MRLVELLSARVDRGDIVIIGEAARRLALALLLDPLDRDAAVGGVLLAQLVEGTGALLLSVSRPSVSGYV